MTGNLLNDVCVFQVINFSSGQVGYGQNEFTRRVGFSVSMPSANLSFYINDTQESDSGLYVCIVIIPGAPSISGQIQLNVKGNGAESEPLQRFAPYLEAGGGGCWGRPLKIGKSRTRFTGSAEIRATVRVEAECDEVTDHLCCFPVD